jgi:hypothetical protein
MASEAQRLREQAERCLRLANAQTRNDVIRNLRALAADYLEAAQALERAEDNPQQQQQQQVGNIVPPPQPSHGVAQQQQQAQPKKPDDPE